MPYRSRNVRPESTPRLDPRDGNLRLPNMANEKTEKRRKLDGRFGKWGGGKSIDYNGVG